MSRKENPKTVGERSEACVLAALLKAGQVVLLPFGDNQRYDLVIDDGGVFQRIQCKTGRLRDGVIVFQPGSCAGGKGRRRGYRGQADLFGVYCPELDSVYLVPLTDVDAVNTAHLRIDPPKDGRNRTVRWAKDYLLS